MKINNNTERLSDELKRDLCAGSRLSIAAARFSVYAFEERKTQLWQIKAIHNLPRPECLSSGVREIILR